MRRLVLRPGAIGDCLLALPALEHLASTSDYTEIWISSAVAPLVCFADEVRPLASTGIDLVGVGDLAIPERLAERLKSFDSIVSWYGANRREFREAIESLGVRYEFLDALPPRGYREHAVDFFCRQVGACVGATPRLPVERAARRRSIAVHPFSGSEKKNWPLASYRDLARQLPLPVEWTAGPEESLEEARRFDDLRMLAEWLSGAAIYIGNDSGITHLAAAAGTPVVALFGETDPAVWGPRGESVSILQRQPLEELTVAEVIEAVNRRLG